MVSLVDKKKRRANIPNLKFYVVYFYSAYLLLKMALLNTPNVLKAKYIE
jgi:hypothetical protein